MEWKLDRGQATITLPDGKVEAFGVNLFTSEKFLYAVQQSGLPAYKAEVERLKREFSALTTEELRAIYLKFGDSMENFRVDIFPNEPKEPESKHTLRSIERWHYGPNAGSFSQHQVDDYADVYKRWMMLSAAGRALEETYESRGISKDDILKQIDDKTEVIRHRLDLVVLGLGGS